MSEDKTKLHENDGLPTFYTDHTQVTISEHSVIFTAAQNQPGPKGERRYVRTARLYMSAEHARVVHFLLGKNLDKLDEARAKASEAEQPKN